MLADAPRGALPGRILACEGRPVAQGRPGRGPGRELVVESSSTAERAHCTSQTGVVRPRARSCSRKARRRHAGPGGQEDERLSRRAAHVQVPAGGSATQRVPTGSLVDALDVLAPTADRHAQQAIRAGRAGEREVPVPLRTFGRIAQLQARPVRR